ncbi:hypothetical protein FQA39_LY18683 [Lamprigera yunnana]|nr:hypothetical protein FQA39_LY18683 [Lamprigera yunnana]
MNDNVEIIRSNKGGLKLIHRGYMYTVHKKRQGGGIRWRCTQRSLHCKGSISTGNGPPSVNMPHNHIPDPHSVALARCRQIEEFPDLASMLETEYEETKDATPLGQRNIVPPASEVLHTQPLSPTKLKLMKNKPCCSKGLARPFTYPPSDEVCLRWNSHHSNMQNCFPRLLEKEQYVDVTVMAEGKTLKCHRMILSSCSSYFEDILSEISPMQHPVIILKGIPFWILRSLIDFMYAGEVNIDQSRLPELLDIAELLKIKGLAEIPKEGTPPPLPPVTKTEESPINDPLELLQPTALSDDGIKNKDKLLARKVFGKKLRKRKSSEDECVGDPLIFIFVSKFYVAVITSIVSMRRGTRSRPNVKVPRYYDYEDIVKPTSSDQPFPLGLTIKSEPPDVDDMDGSYPESQDNEKFKSEVTTEITRVTNEMKPEQLYKIKIKCLTSLSENWKNRMCARKKESSNSLNVTELRKEKNDDILDALEIIKIDVNVQNKPKGDDLKHNPAQIEIIATDKIVNDNDQNIEQK